jgi:hypothetical protein
MSRWGLLSLGLLVVVFVPLRAAPAPERKVPRELLVERRDAARDTYHMTCTIWRFPPPKGLGVKGTEFSKVILWSERWVEAELPLCKNAAERAAALKTYVERARQHEELMLQAFRIVRVTRAAVTEATYARAQAEIRYFEATGKRLPRKTADDRPKEELPRETLVKPRDDSVGEQPRVISPNDTGKGQPEKGRPPKEKKK